MSRVWYRSSHKVTPFTYANDDRKQERSSDALSEMQTHRLVFRSPRTDTHALFRFRQAVLQLSWGNLFGTSMLPTLYTDRLVLTSVDPQVDPLSIFEQWSSPQVGPFVLATSHASLANARRFVDATLLTRSRGFGLWILEWNGYAAKLGYAGLFSPDGNPDTEEVESFIQLRCEYWGLGLATEAMTAIIQIAFSFLPITAIRASILRHNTRSRVLFERLGFRLLSSDAESYQYHLSPHDVPPDSKPLSHPRQLCSDGSRAIMA